MLPPGAAARPQLREWLPHATSAASVGQVDASSAGLLTALTRLTVHWSSAEHQRRVAERVGLEFDDTAIRAVYVIGLLGQARAGVIADELRLTRPTVSKLLARLERAHLATSPRARADTRRRRKRSVVPTVASTPSSPAPVCRCRRRPPHASTISG